ncbi:putative 3,2-trans-enoyl-CoA isomerase [Cercophora samala]|uniref:3,2-trans-enoyl-CoA isomerase n=1 Tax=Cercophora samala TaxID=330535 RepID=A0AA39ZMV4_9PEZI|nr:putative 3,2-trans-enoyl-CoA isomerase [Cercophora samala]
MASSEPSPIQVEYRGRLAIVTINNPEKLGALNGQGYYDLAQALRQIATHDEVFITLLIGTGRFFSAGADVTITRTTPATASVSPHQQWLSSFVANNLNATHAFYTHPKILITALNGPVIGLSAALISFSDFIYCVPHTFLLTPFASLGLVAEGGASRQLVQKLGPARSGEALIMSRKIESHQLEQCGFVNKVFTEVGKGPGEDEKFKRLVLAEIDDKLGEHLVGESLLGIKKLIRRPEREALDSHNVAEVFAGLDRFVSGVPQQEFEKIASGKKRHKL